MIDLDALNQDCLWLDLPRAVRVHVRPYDMVAWELARLRSGELAARLTEESRAAADLGVAVLDLPNLDDPLARQAVGNSLFTIALAQAVIVAWEGVGKGEQPAPVTPEMVAALMRVQGMGDAFLHAYVTEYRIGDEAAEGNG